MYKPLLTMLLATMFVTGHAASFDCQKASTFVEKEICSNALLGKLDEALDENYKSMQAADFGASRKTLKAEQLKWLSTRNKCATTKCIIDTYRKRVDETCDYGVVSGVHPPCTLADDVN
jgi:uncharacterized protein